jgi:hypothetical protein
MMAGFFLSYSIFTNSAQNETSLTESHIAAANGKSG